MRLALETLSVLPGPLWEESGAFYEKSIPEMIVQKVFMQHKAVSTKKYVETITYSKAATTEVIVTSFFINFKQELGGISPSCIWNYNQTSLHNIAVKTPKD